MQSNFVFYKMIFRSYIRLELLLKNIYIQIQMFV